MQAAGERRAGVLARVGVAAGLLVALPAGLASATTKTTSPVGVTFTGGCKGWHCPQKGWQGPRHRVRSRGLRGDLVAPVEVDPRRDRRLVGVEAVAFADHTWWLHIDGFPALSGGSANASHEKSASGSVNVDADIPSWLGLTGEYYVNGQISGWGARAPGRSTSPSQGTQRPKRMQRFQLASLCRLGLPPFHLGTFPRGVRRWLTDRGEGDHHHGDHGHRDHSHKRDIGGRHRHKCVVEQTLGNWELGRELILIIGVLPE